MFDASCCGSINDVFPLLQLFVWVHPASLPKVSHRKNCIAAFESSEKRSRLVEISLHHRHALGRQRLSFSCSRVSCETQNVRPSTQLEQRIDYCSTLLASRSTHDDFFVKAHEQNFVKYWGEDRKYWSKGVSKIVFHSDFIFSDSN